VHLAQNRVASTSLPGLNIRKCFCARGMSQKRGVLFRRENVGGGRGKVVGAGRRLLAIIMAGCRRRLTDNTGRSNTQLSYQSPTPRATPIPSSSIPRGRQTMSKCDFSLEILLHKCLVSPLNSNLEICFTGILNYARVLLYWGKQAIGGGGKCGWWRIIENWNLSYIYWM